MASRSFAVLHGAVDLALQGREVAAAAEQRFDIAFLCGLLADAIEVSFDAGEPLEVGLTKFSASDRVSSVEHASPKGDMP